MESLYILYTLLSTIFILLALWLSNRQSFWKRQNVPDVNIMARYKEFKRRHIAYILQDIYTDAYQKKLPFVGLKALFSPTLLVQDLDFLKTIMITEFDSIPNRGFYVNHNDPLSENLVRLDRDLWRPLRQKLTPSFTSGKMKMMFPTLLKVGEQLLEVLEENIDNAWPVFDMRDMCARFTTDIIGSIAFGIECNSLKDPKTEFRIQGDQAFELGLHPFIDNFGSHHPKLLKFFNIKVYKDEQINFFSRLVTENIKERETKNIKRNDFMDTLIELKNQRNLQGEPLLNMMQLIGQAFVFFVAGFETSSSTMTYALYELAKNSEVQEKARQDVKAALAKFNGELTYESLNEMKYLKMVLQETLRKHPVVPSMTRETKGPITFKEPRPLYLESNMTVIIPIYSIHHNPDYYPQPEKFIPERFLPEEVAKRHTMAYLPFGAGPRACIAERFGKMQSTMGVALILSKFLVSVSSQTPENLTFDPLNIFVFSHKNGLYLKLEKL